MILLLLNHLIFFNKDYYFVTSISVFLLVSISFDFVLIIFINMCIHFLSFRTRCIRAGSHSCFLLFAHRNERWKSTGRKTRVSSTPLAK